MDNSIKSRKRTLNPSQMVNRDNRIQSFVAIVGEMGKFGTKQIDRSDKKRWFDTENLSLAVNCETNEQIASHFSVGIHVRRWNGISPKCSNVRNTSKSLMRTSSQVFFQHFDDKSRTTSRVSCEWMNSETRARHCIWYGRTFCIFPSQDSNCRYWCRW